MLRKDKYKMNSVISNALICIDKDKKINVIDYYSKQDLCEEEYNSLDVNKYFPNICAIIKLINLYSEEYKILNTDIDKEYVKQLAFEINTYYTKVIADKVIVYNSHYSKQGEVE